MKKSSPFPPAHLQISPETEWKYLQWDVLSFLTVNISSTASVWHDCSEAAHHTDDLLMSIKNISSNSWVDIFEKFNAMTIIMI